MAFILVWIVINLAYRGRCSEEGNLSEEGRDDAFITFKEGRKTGTAQAACRDKDPSCEDWAKKGECEKNKGFMSGSCPVSCKECTPPELHAEDYVGQTLIMSTRLGDIRVRMLFDNAPRSCALVLELAHQGCDRCNFYRVEHAPTVGDGPPYGLLQGSVTGLLRGFPEEGNRLPVKYGNVATISGMDFYIAAMDHSSWGGAHVSWGEVENMEVVERILNETKFHEVTHPVGTVMRMANDPLPFSLKYEPSSSLKKISPGRPLDTGIAKE